MIKDIEELDDGYFYATIVVDGVLHDERYFDTRDEAEDWLEEYGDPPKR